MTETIVLTNNGPSPAYGAVLNASWTSDAKGGIDFESASVSSGPCSTSGASVACTVGDFAKGQQVQIS